MKRLVLDTIKLARYDYGEDIGFKVYNEDETAFDATGLTATVLKCFKRHEDQRYFFRDVAKAIQSFGELARVIDDIPITWDTISSGEGHFAFTDQRFPSISGYTWFEIQLLDDPVTKRISTELIRVYIQPSEVS